MTTDVLIIGAGPAGLTLARSLRAAGADVLVLERAPEAGGLPRFAAHPGWGMLDLHRLYGGPAYARRLAELAGVPVQTGVSVTRLFPGGEVEASTPDGMRRFFARAVVLATGIREMPRSARLIGGARPAGVINTGAFQEMVYAGHMKPFAAPVIVGTELVAFSALLTARHAGIRPVAMLEEGPRIVARRPGDLVARTLFGVPVRTGVTVREILGTGRVEGVVIEGAGGREVLACDGVILTGRFVPEAALARLSRLDVDPGSGGPLVDDHFRTSDRQVFAAGNLLRPVEHSGFVALEARRVAAAVMAHLAGTLPPTAPAISVTAGEGLRYVMPQRVTPGTGPVTVQTRASETFSGRFEALLDGRLIAARNVSTRPERRLTLTLDKANLAGGGGLTLRLAKP